MSIDARIEAVTVIAPDHCNTCNGGGKDPETGWDDCPHCHGATKENPQVRLKLGPREPGGVAGQTVLTIVNPSSVDPEQLSLLLGVDIWGGNGFIMLGDRRWATRVGYTKIRLLEPQHLECRSEQEVDLDDSLLSGPARNSPPPPAYFDGDEEKPF